ncbi:MAG: protelomerase family protein [Cyanobacteria bacterium P01_A01_bin.37]
MPTVTAVPVERFQQYVSGLRFPKKLEAHVPLFLAKLSQTKSARTIEQLCKDEKAWFEEQYTNPNTRAAHMTRYRKAISSMVAGEGIELTKKTGYPQQTQNGLVYQHLALTWMNYGAEFHEARQKTTKSKTKEQRRNRIAFEPWPLVEAANAALTSTDYRESAAGIIAVTGRRPTEILKSGDFDIVSKYKVEFTGQLKAKGKTEGYPIYSLVPANLLIDAFTTLRRDADVKELQKLENTKVDSQRNSTLNRAIGRVFGEVLQPPVGEKFLSAKNLRAAYTNVAYHFFSTPSESIGSFAEDYLGHQGASSAPNYEDYYCVDDRGQPLAIGILRHELSQQAAEPLADKRATVHIDGLLKERFDAFGSGTHKDKLAQLLDMADRYEAVERQRDKAVAERDKAVASLKEFVGNGVPAMELIQLPQKPKRKREHLKTPDDWTTISNADLLGGYAQVPGSSGEKIRRSIEALKEHNAGLPDAEQWAITPTVIMKLSGSRSDSLNTYFKEHPEVARQLEQYNAGFGYHQNRGKGNPRDSVKWSSVYGEYEW